MREREILKKIDEMTAMHLLGTIPDASMQKRRALIDCTAESFLSAQFLDQMNGAVFHAKDDRVCSVIACSVFLDKICVNTLLKQEEKRNIFLLTHHFFDIDCGRPGTDSGRGFSMVDAEALRELYLKGIQICSVHLPLDLNQSSVNTHRAFARRLGLFPEDDLLNYPFGKMGYVARSTEAFWDHFSGLFPEVVSYGKMLPAEEPETGIAVVAGMISSPEMLKKIEERGCKILICGDVLLRNGSKRTRQMEAYLQQTSLSIYCVSHYQSEFWALKELAERVAGPEMETLLIYDGKLWK